MHEGVGHEETARLQHLLQLFHIHLRRRVALHHGQHGLRCLSLFLVHLQGVAAVRGGAAQEAVTCEGDQRGHTDAAASETQERSHYCAMVLLKFVHLQTTEG